MYRLTFKISCDIVFDVVDHLEHYFDTVSCFEDEASAPSQLLDDNEFPIASLFDVEILFQDQTHALLVDILLSDINAKATEMKLEKVDDQDWLEVCYKNFQPIRIGSFFIHSSYAPEKVPENAIGLLIDAATAFGSGEHQTTRGCLLAISNILDDQEDIDSVLDMGCGSGILGIAASLKNPNLKVLCADMDEKAVSVASGNFLLNKTSTIKAITSAGFEKISDKYDLLIANILAKPLIEMAPDMKKHANEGAFVVLSGLLSRQKEAVLSAYQQENFIPVEEYNIDDWCTLVLEKGA